MKTIFITGGTSGLGLELSKHFLNLNYKVAVCSIEAEVFARKNISKEMIYYQADVTNVERMSEVINDLKKKTGQLDIVVANAGINMSKAKIPDFDRGRDVINTNVIGVLNTFEPAIKIMKEQGNGQLVGLSSISGTIGGLPGMAIYGASKSAVYTLCEALEIDLASFGISVTTIAPGFIDTPLTKDNTHSQPFLLSQEKAGEMIFHAVHKKKGLYLFPFPINIVGQILRRLPRNLYKWIMKKDFLGTGRCQ